MRIQRAGATQEWYMGKSQEARVTFGLLNEGLELHFSEIRGDPRTPTNRRRRGVSKITLQLSLEEVERLAKVLAELPRRVQRARR